MKFLVLRPRLAQVISFVVLNGFLTTSATISTGSHYDETTNFGAYQTFSWIDDVPYISDASTVRISPLTQNKIQQAIQAQSKKKGYTYIEDRKSTDLVLAYTVGTRDKIGVNSHPIDFREGNGSRGVWSLVVYYVA